MDSCNVWSGLVELICGWRLVCDAQRVNVVSAGLALPHWGSEVIPETDRCTYNSILYLCGHLGKVSIYIPGT